MTQPLYTLHVAVLAGGPGSEREVSLNSAKGVAGALEGLVGKVTLVDVKGPGFDLPAGTDLAFNVIHGTFGEDGQLQAELERRGIPYTGARRVSSETAFDKVLSKQRFLDAGVITPASEVIFASKTASAARVCDCALVQPHSPSLPPPPQA